MAKQYIYNGIDLCKAPKCDFDDTEVVWTETIPTEIQAGSYLNLHWKINSSYLNINLIPDSNGVSWGTSPLRNFSPSIEGSVFWINDFSTSILVPSNAEGTISCRADVIIDQRKYSSEILEIPIVTGPGPGPDITIETLYSPSQTSFWYDLNVGSDCRDKNGDGKWDDEDDIEICCYIGANSNEINRSIINNDGTITRTNSEYDSLQNINERISVNNCDSDWLETNGFTDDKKLCFQVNGLENYPDLYILNGYVEIAYTKNELDDSGTRWISPFYGGMIRCLWYNDREILPPGWNYSWNINDHFPTKNNFFWTQFLPPPLFDEYFNDFCKKEASDGSGFYIDSCLNVVSDACWDDPDNTTSCCMGFTRNSLARGSTWSPFTCSGQCSYYTFLFNNEAWLRAVIYVGSLSDFNTTPEGCWYPPVNPYIYRSIPRKIDLIPGYSNTLINLWGYGFSDCTYPCGSSSSSSSSFSSSSFSSSSSSASSISSSSSSFSSSSSSTSSVSSSSSSNSSSSSSFSSSSFSSSSSSFSSSSFSSSSSSESVSSSSSSESVSSSSSSSAEPYCCVENWPVFVLCADDSDCAVADFDYSCDWVGIEGCDSSIGCSYSGDGTCGPDLYCYYPLLQENCPVI